MDTMRAAVYSPPQAGLPYIAVVFHRDLTVAMTHIFSDPEAAQQYILDICSSLVTMETGPVANA